MTTTCTMILGDCLEVMPELPLQSAHACIADLPYGLTKTSWDICPSLDAFWRVWSVVRRSHSSAVCFANLKHMMNLIKSNIREFRYELVWSKKRGTNGMLAKVRPIPSHEYLCIFGRSPMTYNIQMEPSNKLPRIRTQRRTAKFFSIECSAEKRLESSTSLRHPLSVRICSVDNLSRNGSPLNSNTFYHPTQKPVALLDWIIRTYSNAGDMVLDPTSGSGTTAVAAATCGRNVTCIEKDEGYFETSVERVRKRIRDNLLDVKLDVRK